MGIFCKRSGVRPKYFANESLVPSSACRQSLGKIGEMAVSRFAWSLGEMILKQEQFWQIVAG